MTYKCEEETTQRAEEYIKCLKKENISAEISMVADHMCKVRILASQKNYGNAIIYYKPSKDIYSLKFHELKDKSISDRLKDIWDVSFNENKKIITDNLDEKIFINALVKSNESSAEGKTHRTEEYYNILKKYRNLRFDFIELAVQLKKDIEEFSDERLKTKADKLLGTKEIEEYRYDFDRLESIHKILGGQYYE